MCVTSHSSHLTNGCLGLDSGLWKCCFIPTVCVCVCPDASFPSWPNNRRLVLSFLAPYSLPLSLSFFLSVGSRQPCGLFSWGKINCFSRGWKYMDLLLTIYTSVWVGLHYLIGIKQKNAYLHGNSIHWSLEMKGHNYWQTWHHFLFPVDVFTEPEYTLTHIPLCVCSEWLCIGMLVESQPGLCFFMLFWEMQTYLCCFSEWICILFCLALLARPLVCAVL